MMLPPPIAPLPLLPSLVFSISLMVFQNVRPISEALMTRHLRTRTRIKNLSLSPFQLNVKGIRLMDSHARSLLTADALSVRITLKKMLFLNIVASGLVLHADINPTDWQESNWSAHLAQITEQTCTHTTVTNPAPKREARDVGKLQVPKGCFALSVAARHATVQIRRPPVTLPLPPLVIPSTNLSSISAIQNLVNGLLGRAARIAGTRSFPRELSVGARRAARGVAVSAVDNVFEDAGKKIGEWREKVERVRAYLEDTPDIDRAQSTITNIGGLLQQLEGMFLRDDNKEKRNTTTGDGEETRENCGWLRELDEGDAGN